MTAVRKVSGPYRVKNIGVGGDMYEVVEMADNFSNIHLELRPRYTTQSRQAAFGKCLRLNRRWQNEHVDEPELIERWQQATN